MTILYRYTHTAREKTAETARSQGEPAAEPAEAIAAAPESRGYPRARDGWEAVRGRTGGWYYRKVR